MIKETENLAKLLVGLRPFGGTANMDELVKVLLYKGDERLDGVEMRRDEFERVLDELFTSDSVELDVTIGEGEVKGVTDLILSGVVTTEDDDFTEEKKAA